MKKLLILLMLISGEAMAEKCDKMGTVMVCWFENESCVYQIERWGSKAELINCSPVKCKPKSK